MTREILHKTTNEMELEVWNILGYKDIQMIEMWGGEIYVSKKANGYVTPLQRYTSSIRIAMDLVDRALEMDFAKEYTESLLYACWFTPPQGVLALLQASAVVRVTSWLQAYHKYKGKEVVYMLKE